MTTERMTENEERAETIREFLLDQEEPSDGALDALARMEKENESLREQLRLANDKMAEQVRQALHATAHDALLDCDTLADFIARMERIRDANAPKD